MTREDKLARVVRLRESITFTIGALAYGEFVNALECGATFAEVWFGTLRVTDTGSIVARSPSGERLYGW